MKEHFLYRIKRLPLKLTALLVAGAFLLSDLAYGAGDRFAPSLSKEALRETLLRDPASLEVPLDFVTPVEVHKGNKDTLIIHIQDAHANFSGQENLARALDKLMARYGSYPVLVEGGSRDDTLTCLKKVAPQAVWKKVARSFLLQGKISGEEYLNLTSDHPMKILGIEDPDLYWKSVKSYAELAEKRERILEYLKKIQSGLEKLKRKYYPKELLEYERSKGEGRRWKENQSLKELLTLAKQSRISLKDFPDLRRLRSLVLPLKARETFILPQALDFHALVEEEDLLEEKLYRSRLTTPDPQRIRAFDRFFSLLAAAYNIQMTTRDFKLFQLNEKDFMTPSYLAFMNRKLAENGYFEDLIPYESLLEEGKKSLRAFYDSVSERDLAFIKNTESILKRENQRVVFLITGGYHTPHLKELFKEDGYSYVVLTPIVTSETNQKKYEGLLLAPLQKEIKTVQPEVMKQQNEVRIVPTFEDDGRFQDLAVAAARLARTSDAVVDRAMSDRELQLGSIKVRGKRAGLAPLAIDEIARQSSIEKVRLEVKKFPHSRVVAVFNEGRGKKYGNTTCPLCSMLLEANPLSPKIGEYVLLPNTYPAVDGALIQITGDHRPSKWDEKGIQNLMDTVNFAPDYLVTRNEGNTSGGSVPGHDHNQLMPWPELEKVMGDKELPVQYANTRPIAILRSAQVKEFVDWYVHGLEIEGKSEDVEAVVLHAVKAFKSDFNFLGWRKEDLVKVLLFPRSKSVSDLLPKRAGCLEVSGVVFAPQWQAFQKLQLADIEKGLREVGVTDEVWQAIRLEIEQTVVGKAVEAGARLAGQGLPTQSGMLRDSMEFDKAFLEFLGWAADLPDKIRSLRERGEKKEALRLKAELTKRRKQFLRRLDIEKRKYGEAIEGRISSTISVLLERAEKKLKEGTAKEVYISALSLPIMFLNELSKKHKQRGLADVFRNEFMKALVTKNIIREPASYHGSRVFFLNITSEWVRSDTVTEEVMRAAIGGTIGYLKKRGKETGQLLDKKTESELRKELKRIPSLIYGAHTEVRLKDLPPEENPFKSMREERASLLKKGNLSDYTLSELKGFFGENGEFSFLPKTIADSLSKQNFERVVEVFHSALTNEGVTDFQKDLNHFDDWPPAKRDLYYVVVDAYHSFRREALYQEATYLHHRYKTYRMNEADEEADAMSAEVSESIERLLWDAYQKLYQRMELAEPAKVPPELRKIIWDYTTNVDQAAIPVLDDQAARSGIKEALLGVPLEKGLVPLHVLRDPEKLRPLAKFYALLSVGLSKAIPILNFSTGRLARPKHRLGGMSKNAEGFVHAFKNFQVSLNQDPREFADSFAALRDSFYQYALARYEAVVLSSRDQRMYPVSSYLRINEEAAAEMDGRFLQLREHLERLSHGEAAHNLERSRDFKKLEDFLHDGFIVFRRYVGDEIGVLWRGSNGDYRLIFVEFAGGQDFFRKYPPDSLDTVMHRILKEFTRIVAAYVGKDDASELILKFRKGLEEVLREEGKDELFEATEKAPRHGKEGPIERMSAYVLRRENPGFATRLVNSVGDVLYRKAGDQPWTVLLKAGDEGYGERFEEFHKRREPFRKKLGLRANYWERTISPDDLRTTPQIVKELFDLADEQSGLQKKYLGDAATSGEKLDKLFRLVKAQEQAEQDVKKDPKDSGKQKELAQARNTTRRFIRGTPEGARLSIEPDYKAAERYEDNRRWDEAPETTFTEPEVIEAKGARFAERGEVRRFMEGQKPLPEVKGVSSGGAWEELLRKDKALEGVLAGVVLTGREGRFPMASSPNHTAFFFAPQAGGVLFLSPSFTGSFGAASPSLLSSGFELPLDKERAREVLRKGDFQGLSEVKETPGLPGVIFSEEASRHVDWLGRLAVKAYRRGGLANDKTVVLKIVVDGPDGKILPLEEADLIRRTLESLRPLIGENVYPQFVKGSLEPYRKEGYLSEVPVLEKGRYETIVLGAPASETLSAAEAAGSSILPTERAKEEGWVIPYLAAIVAAIMIARSEKGFLSEELRQLLINLIRQERMIDIGLPEYQALKEVHGARLSFYQKLSVKLVRLTLQKLFESIQGARLAVGSAA